MVVRKEQLGRFLRDIKKAEYMLSWWRNFSQAGKRDAWSIPVPHPGSGIWNGRE